LQAPRAHSADGVQASALACGITEVITYIDTNRCRFGVEPICSVLQFVPRTYYAAKARTLSARAVRGTELKPDVAREHRENFGDLWRR